MAAVSVCIPTFNFGRFIADAIRSVLSQSFKDFELIVVDNCSTDDTRAVVEQFARSDARIRFYSNAFNIGMVENFNRCLELATGQYVKILCADDLLTPLALEISVNALESHPGAVLVTGGRVLVGEDLVPMGFASYGREDAVVRGGTVIDRCLFGTNYVGEPSAVMFRREQAVRGFDTSYLQLLDMELWFHLLEHGNLVCIAQPLALIRQHVLQTTKSNQRTGLQVADKQRLFSVYVNKPYVQRSRLRLYQWRLRTAYNAWTGGGTSRQIAEFVPPLLFYVILPFIVILHRMLSLTGRFSARSKMKHMAAKI